MAFHTPVPSETDPSSMGDLVNDCREVVSVLAHSVIDLTSTVATRAVRVPLARVPLDRLPFSFGAMPVEITEDLLVTVSGLDDY
jgi:hypothetical protein